MSPDFFEESFSELAGEKRKGGLVTENERKNLYEEQGAGGLGLAPAFSLQRF